MRSSFTEINEDLMRRDRRAERRAAIVALIAIIGMAAVAAMTVHAVGLFLELQALLTCAGAM